MPDGPQGKIFINYRRGDDSAAAGRLYDRLEQEFDKDNLFMDVDAIGAGQDFVAVLERQVAQCDVHAFPDSRVNRESARFRLWWSHELAPISAKLCLFRRNGKESF